MSKNRYKALIIDDFPELPADVYNNYIKEKLKNKHELDDPDVHNQPIEPSERNLKEVDFILLDMKFENSDKDGVWYLSRLAEFNEIRKSKNQIPIPVIVYSQFEEIENCLKNYEHFEIDEIFAIIPKAPAPGSQSDRFALVFTIDRVCRWVEKEKELKALKKANDPDLIKGNSDATQKLRETIANIAPTDASVLIFGETGVGKELVARTIHLKSNRRNGPFVALNMSTYSKSTIEGELFGWVQGAFTGATKDRKGRFEEADGGTIFLDEIGDMDYDLQNKILRVLEEKEVLKLGQEKPLKIDLRILAGTNKDLKDEVGKKNFREDLYYRLNVVPISVCALRDRKDEIEILAIHFIKKFNNRHNRKVKNISSEALKKLGQYSWPGNVRELSNIIERAVISSSGNYIIGAEEIVLTDENGDKNFAKGSGIEDHSIKQGNFDPEIATGLLLKDYDSATDKFLNKFGESQYRYLQENYSKPTDPTWKELWKKYIAEREYAVESLKGFKKNNEMYQQLYRNRQNVKLINDCIKQNLETRGEKALQWKISMVMGIKRNNLNAMIRNR